MSSEKRKRGFISYGHKDGFDFVRRLAFSLEMYVDVFWDRRLRYGQFDKQLNTEIENCDFLIIVMTPYALRDEGWCHIELKHAKNNSKPIVPIKLHDDCGFEKMEAQLEHNQYADFRKNFDAGFQQLTQILLGHPYLSWEFMPRLSDEDLLRQISKGRLPALILKELAESLIIEQIWQTIELYAKNTDTIYVLSRPKTPVGFLKHCEDLLVQLENRDDNIGFLLVEKMQKLIRNYFQSIVNLPDDNHSEAGKVVDKFVADVKQFLQKNTFSDSDEVLRFKIIEEFYDFEVSEKLRELINIHARRSKYLY